MGRASHPGKPYEVSSWLGASTLCFSTNLFLKENVFSVGSTLGLERPYISSLDVSAIEGKDEFCLEYGSATHLYLVPSILQEERVDEHFLLLFFLAHIFALFFDISPMWMSCLFFRFVYH